MQAIQVKYLPATDTKHSRLKAFCKSGSITIPFDTETDNQCYVLAAKLLAEKLGWNEVFYGGTLPNHDKVFVIPDDHITFSL